jgi:hypothetical protein
MTEAPRHIFRRNDPYRKDAMAPPLAAFLLADHSIPRPSVGIGHSIGSIDATETDSNLNSLPTAPPEPQHATMVPNQSVQLVHSNAEAVPRHGGSPTGARLSSLAPTEQRSKRTRGGRQRAMKPSTQGRNYTDGGPTPTLSTFLDNKWMDTQPLLLSRPIRQYLQYPTLFPVPKVDLERQIAFLNELPPHLLESVLLHSNLIAGAESMPVEGQHRQPPSVAPMAHRYLATYLPFLPYPSFADGTTALPASYPALDPHSSTSDLFIPTLEELVSGLGYDGQFTQAFDFFHTSNDADLRSSSPGELHCRFHRRLFVGNIKKDLPLRFLQWLLELVSAPSLAGHQPANAAYLYDASIHRHASNGIFKGCIHVTLATNEDPEIHRQLLQKRVLFDHNGAWFATSEAEERLLLAYTLAIGRLPEASPFRAPMGNLPRSAMSWEEASNRDTARCTRRSETREAFVQQLLDSRNGPVHDRPHSATDPIVRLGSSPFGSAPVRLTGRPVHHH